MSDERGHAFFRVACVVLLLFALPAVGEAAPPPSPDLTSARLADVAIRHQPDATIVHVKTVGAARYRAELIDSPDRLVIDLEDTVYGWRKTPLVVDRAPVKAIRGSQYRRGVARLVLEFTHKVGYALREDADGLSIVIPAGTPAPESAASQPTPRVLAAAAAPAPKPDEPRSGDQPTARTAGPESAKSAPASATPAPASPATTAKAEPAAAPQIAQTGGAVKASGNGRLISLDFKDADVVNLLRILAAESGRNIVIGDDVKGKMSISLRNVPWDLALDTILSVRGLERLERDGVMRIVSTEQLTKEREARARVEEAKIKGEAEARAKLAEAQVKEAEAVQRKLAALAAQREAEARGPLREETIRLSYADPEEVAKTLQGILGIPAEGQKVQGPGYIMGPIAEPPFSQLFGPGAQAAPPAPPVSVSQDVLAKGLTIRAHKPTNTLFLRLYAADLERVKTLIRESLDVPLPQVKIEARMEILDRTALEQIGIQWGGATAQPAGSYTLVGQGFDPLSARGGIGVQQLTPANSNLTLDSLLPVSAATGLPFGGNLVNLPISALPNAGALPAAGLAFGIVGNRLNINLALQALASQGKTRTLARPEIVTVENNKAVMSLGEEIPYATISSAGTQIQFKEALLKLEVTPTVIQEGDETKIKLVVVVENNSRGDVVNLGNAGAPPAINRRKAETQVLIREGDRLVIGGVTTSVNQNTVRKVPLLGDIPLLGWLFKQREDFETGRELVVFLTPTVLRPSTATAAATPAPGSPRPR